MLYLCKFSAENIIATDRYLIKILLVASYHSKHKTNEEPMANNCGRNHFDGKIDKHTHTHTHTHTLRLQKAQLDRKWVKWTLYRTHKDCTRIFNRNITLQCLSV